MPVSGSRENSGVLGFHRGDGVDAVGSPQRLRIDLGEAEVSNPSSADEVGHRADGVFDGRVRIDPVQVVQVDVVDSQPTGTVLEGLADRFRSAAAALDLGAELGGEDHVVAAVGQHPGDELLVMAIAVDVGGIDVVDTPIQGRTQQCLGLAVLGDTVDTGQAHRPNTNSRNRCGGLA